MRSSPRKDKVIIDFDGSRIALPKRYKDIKKQGELFRQAHMDQCPHPAVMLTIRCQICGTIEVHIIDFFPKKGATIKLSVPEAHNHSL